MTREFISNLPGPAKIAVAPDLVGYHSANGHRDETDLGHDKPALLLNSHTDETPTRLVNRYARRMLIENAIG